jgi:hypothetical protein
MDLPDKLRNSMAAETDPLLRFKSLLKAHLEVASEYRRESRIFFLDHYPVDQTRNKVNVELQNSILGIYVDELTNLKRHGVIKTRHIKIMALTSGSIELGARWYWLDGKLKPKKVKKKSSVVGGLP